ncbi:MAG: CotH kinase family protein, partial [Planctomycetota bacterium]
MSYGLDAAGLAVYFDRPTPGAANDATAASAPQVFVSEIMYHPSSNNDQEEFVELYNGDAAPIDLAGWSLKAAVEFELPSVVLDAGDYLVVAADPVAFTAKYGVTVDVVGGWRGSLANSGETLRLHDASGRQVDVVEYRDEGQWAARERGPLDRGHEGWVWSDAHDGEGASLELASVSLPNNWGQNWAASSVPGGTPGAINSIADTDGDAAPLLLDLAHFPAIPQSTDPVVVTARLLDELPTGLSATLSWRVDGAASFFSSPMVDDGSEGDAVAGDQIFSATLPALPNGTVVEFYATSVDKAGNARVFPKPSQPSGAQQTNLLYHVDDSFDASSLPALGERPQYRLIMTENERAELELIGSMRPDALSHAAMNGTLVSASPQGVDVRYLVGIRNRGHGSATRMPNSYHVDIPRDDLWQGIRSFNLNTQYTHLQLAGLRLFHEAGLIAEEAVPVEALVNGEELTDPAAPSYGVYLQLEVADGLFVENHFEGDSGGNLYRVRPHNGQRWGDLRDLGSDPTAYEPFYEKKTNAAEADYSDLIELVDALNNSTDVEYYERVSQVVDIDQWLGYFAMIAILGNRETMLGSGSGDDYFLYRGVDDPRFVLIPHDLDTIFGQGDTPSSPTDSIYEATKIPTVERFLAHPEIAPAYHAKLQMLLETTFSKPTLDPFLDDVLSAFAPDNRIADMKSYMDARRAFILDTVAAPLTATASLPQAGGFWRTEEDVAALRGTAPLAGTRSVTVNGIEAKWDPTTGQWAIGESPITLVAAGETW